MFRALIAVALGHAASVGLFAGAVASGFVIDRSAVTAIAVGLIVVAAIVFVRRRAQAHSGAPAGRAALGLCSFAICSAHGAGMVLVPALMSICFGS